MRKIYKNILAIFIVIFGFLLLEHKSASDNNSIDKNVLSRQSVVSVSVRDIESGKVVFERDSHFLLHPASTLKALTSPVMIETLGSGCKISTGLYRDTSGNIYLKLGADPLLNTNDIIKLINGFKIKGYKSIKGKLIIDDGIVDDNLWGTGWMWDDENNPYMPKYSAYNLNRNTINIKITPTAVNLPPKITISPYYPVKIINTAVTSTENNISAERKVCKSPENIYVSGKISKITEIKLPVGNPETFFKYQFSKAIKTSGIDFTGLYSRGKLPKNAVLITEISRNIIDEIKSLNHNSDNLAAESLFKLAGAKYTARTGSTEAGLKAFNDFYTKLGLDTSVISIVDASGVSHNDLITADWATLALTKLSKWRYFDVYKSTLAAPGEQGTLNNRLLDLKGNLYAKTGTNAGMSAILGYINTKSGKTYAFSLIIQNFIGSSKPAKELEDSVLRSL